MLWNRDGIQQTATGRKTKTAEHKTILNYRSLARSTVNIITKKKKKVKRFSQIFDQNF